MALTFDNTSVPDARDPGTVAVLRDRCRTVVLLCDGGGSWGAGIEAAAWSLLYLKRRWSGTHLPEPSVLLADVASLRSVIPKELLESDLGVAFSLVLLDCSGSAVRYLASGLFSVVLFDGSTLHTLFQPDTLGAELIRQGTMTEADASRFRHIGVGPWITDEALDPKMSEEVVIKRGCYLLVMHMGIAEQLDAAILQKVLSSSNPAEALQVSLGAKFEISAVIVAG